MAAPPLSEAAGAAGTVGVGACAGRALASAAVGGSPQAPVCGSGGEMLQQKRWAVVGRGTNRTVQGLLTHLGDMGREALHVDPSGASPGASKSLADLPLVAAI